MKSTLVLFQKLLSAALKVVAALSFTVISKDWTF